MAGGNGVPPVPQKVTDDRQALCHKDSALREDGMVYLEALDFGIELEVKSMRYYQDLIDRSQEPAEKEFLARLLEEEKGHHRALIDMKFYLQDPAGYFRETEKGGLDG